MSDTTFDSVYKLRGELEKNLSAALACDLASYTRLNAGTFQKARSRFEWVVRIGSPNGHRKIITLDDRRYDQFNFNLGLMIISNSVGALSPNPGESAEDFKVRQELQNGFHAELVAHVDAYMSQIQLSSVNDTATFPILTLLYLRGAGHEPSLKPEEGNETTKLNYTGQFGIRPGAWTV
jgi:hypothetical protein